MRAGGSRCRGFTLTEILVALAIMVILFGLLFAPMMAGLDWVVVGRANVGLQDACRYAMEQIRRELGEAVYVYPATGEDISPTQRIIDYSQINFNPPRRDLSGRVALPIEADYEINPVSGARMPIIVRYWVRLADPGTPGRYSEGRSFCLYRQEYRINAGAWELLSENALTPKRGASFIPSQTVLRHSGSGAIRVIDGYAPATIGSEDPVRYLFEGVQFVPERICSEELQTTNGVVYKAKYAAWDGRWPSGFLDQPINTSELDPSVGLYRWVDIDAGPLYDFRWIARADMESRTSSARSIALRWAPDAGAVTCGRQATDGVTYGKKVIFSTADPGAGWYSTSTQAEVTPIVAFPSGPPQDTANAPISYRIDPAQDSAPAVPALIVPGTIKVKVVGTIDLGGGGSERRVIDLKPTNNFDQATIKGDEFCALTYRQAYTVGAGAEPHGTCVEIRLSRYDPPRPKSYALFGAAPADFDTFQLQIDYFYRRNYAYDASRDAAGEDPFVSDMVRVDYSTRAIQNVSLALQRYVDLDPDGTGTVFTAPADEFPNEVRVREQVVVRNVGR